MLLLIGPAFSSEIMICPAPPPPSFPDPMPRIMGINFKWETL